VTQKFASVTALLTQGSTEERNIPFVFNNKEYKPQPNQQWKTDKDGLKRLLEHGRLLGHGKTLKFIRLLDDFPYVEMNDNWDDTWAAGFTENKIYVVQTSKQVIERCILMASYPGDLVLDPTCGSGATAYAAEQWGRRWITCDVSRVPLALARQRLLTATYPWHELNDDKRGPAGGFVYKRKQNRKGEEVGGIVPHITLKSIANNEPPKEEVLVDKPEKDNRITRVTGPFVFEATIPTPVEWEESDDVGTTGENYGDFVERMLEVLRQSPVLHLGDNETLTVKKVRRPAKTLSLSAEALSEEDQPLAFVFGPENGAISEKLVYEAAREARGKSYTHLYVIGFAIQPHARKLVDTSEKAIGIPATYVQATPDLMMKDLLKNTRSSQIFSVCGLPDVDVYAAKDEGKFQVRLNAVDIFDPVTMDTDKSLKGKDVPAWFLDTDYNGMVFHVCQAFFPRTGAWNSVKKELKATHDEAVWDHLAGTESAPFEPGEQRMIAVKVIDDRGNELLVEKEIPEA